MGRISHRARIREVYRDKSSENWDAGRLCRKDGRVHAAASRFYYSLFQSAIYWCDKHGHLDCREYIPRHDEVRQYVASNAGTQARELRQVMMNMAELRTKADYKPILLRPVDMKDPVQKASAARSFLLK